MLNLVTKFRTHIDRGGCALIDQVLVGGMNFLTMILVGRIAGAHQLGLFALGFSIVLLIIAVQESLITTPATIIAPRLGSDQRREYFGHALLMQVALVIVASVALVSIALAVRLSGGTAEIVTGLFVLAGVVPFWCLREFARRLAFADLNARAVLLLDGSVAVLLMIGLAALTYTNQMSAATAWGTAGIATGVGSLGWLCACRRKFRIQWSALRNSLQRNWLTGKWMVVGQTAHIATGETLPWMIAGTLGTEATGILAACRTIFRLVNPLVVTVSNLLTPYAAHAFAAGGQTTINTIVRRTVFGLGTLMFVFVLFLSIFGGSLLALLFGDGYAQYHWLLVLLAVAQLVSLLHMGPGRALLVMDKPHYATTADVVECGIVVAISLPLIHWLQLYGAAASYLAGAIASTWLVFILYRSATSQLGDQTGRSNSHLPDLRRRGTTPDAAVVSMEGVE